MWFLHFPSRATPPRITSGTNGRIPPQLTGAYDLVLNFKASAPLGDGTVSNFSSGAVTWEVCGYNSQ